MARRRLTDIDNQVILAKPEKTEEVAWFYNEIVAARSKITDAMIEAKAKQFDELQICFIKDLCDLLQWTFPEHREKRNRLVWLTNHFCSTQGLGSNEVALSFFEGLKRALKNDYKNPTDFLLSKSEAKRAKKRRKAETKYGEKAIDLPVDNDKTKARKERARIRKEAKKLGISAAEYKKQQIPAA